MAKRSKEPKIEFEPDTWQRFERTVDAVAKAPPQHRVKKAGKSEHIKRAKKR